MPSNNFVARLALCVLVSVAPLSAATFTVTSSNDSGPSTLRDAIERANATPGTNVIDGGATIQLLSPLPAITRPVTLFAYLSIDGTHAGPNANGLIVAASDSVIKEVTFRNFDGDGIVVTGDRNRIEIVDAFNCRNGFRIDGSENVLQDNHATNRAYGIWLTASAARNRIGADNHIIITPPPGTPMGPVFATHNGAAGIRIDGDDNVVRATRALQNGTSGFEINGRGNELLEYTFAQTNTGDGINASAPVLLRDSGADHNGGQPLVFRNATLPVATATSAVDDGTYLVIRGTYHAAAFRAYLVQPVRIDAAQNSLGTFERAAVVTTDGTGQADFAVGTASAGSSSIALFVTEVDAAERPLANSPVSAPLAITSVAAPSQRVTDLEVQATGSATVPQGGIAMVDFAITNHGPDIAQFNPLFVDIDTEQTDYSEIVRISGQDVAPLDSFSWLALAPGETVHIIAKIYARSPAGTTITVRFSERNFLPNAVDPNRVNDATTVSILVTAPANVPTLSPLTLALLGTALLVFAAMRLGVRS